MSREELLARIEAAEKSYEFFLAFAAQGVRDDRESKVGGQLRQSLKDMERALSGLADGVRALVESEEAQGESVDDWGGFLEALDRDARAARAIVRLVGSRPGISSELIDNLNASQHVRAVLTDFFLLDGLLGQER